MDTYLTFELKKEHFAVKVTNVLEVMQKKRITHVPKASDHVLGIINFRGNILPVIDTYSKFNLSQPDDETKNVIIVLEIVIDEKIKEMAVVADKVKDVIEINQSEIQPLPELGLSYNNDYISGAINRDENFILLLNIEKAFSDIDLDNKIDIKSQQTETV